jgi:hypothetical protein
MQLYWLGRSVPELAELPKQARLRLHLKALCRSPWLFVAIILLDCCCFSASLLTTVLIAGDLIRDQGLWAVPVLVICSFFPSWFICRPTMFHFLRPKYRRLREADEANHRSASGMRAGRHMDHESGNHSPSLTVRRDEGWADCLRRYRIILDGVEIGQLGEGEELCQEIGDGQHVIEARIDWAGSQPLRFEVRSRDQFVLVKSALRGWRVLLAVFYVIFAWRRYLSLELEP